MRRLAILLLVQALGVVTLGFVLWFWALARYQASTVASFSFSDADPQRLSGVAAAGRSHHPRDPGRAALLVAGLVLINRRPKT